MLFIDEGKDCMNDEIVFNGRLPRSYFYSESLPAIVVPRIYSLLAVWTSMLTRNKVKFFLSFLQEV